MKGENALACDHLIPLGAQKETMSTTILEKYNKWCDKVRSGSSSILMITQAKGSWFLVHNGQAKKLSSIRTIVYDGDEMTRSEYNDVSPAENACMLLVKDEKKMIMSRGENRLDAFGMESAVSSAKMVFCYARTSQVHILISAHRNSPSVNVMYYPVSGENDAFSLCMQSDSILPYINGATEVRHE